MKVIQCLCKTKVLLTSLPGKSKGMQVEGTVSRPVGEMGWEGEVLDKVWDQESHRSCKDDIFK